MDTVKLPFYARLALILLSLVLILFLLQEGRDIFIPLVFALLISILLYPLNRFFEQKLRMGRGLSAALCITLFVAVLFGFFYLLSMQMANFAEDFPVLKTRFQGMFYKIPIKLIRGPKQDIKLWSCIMTDQSKGFNNSNNISRNYTADENITDDIKPLLGPNNDFHSQKITPLDLGYPQLCVDISSEDDTLSLYNKLAFVPGDVVINLQ